MRLILHPKVYSDIAQVMEYYEQVAGADLADEFYAELRQLMREAAERPQSFPTRERDFAEPTRGDFHIIFCFVLRTMLFEFWSSATTKENHR